jgi:MoxR-vWA-beta-propeller ternary system domain bpX1/MoxR-vWA-beta-propeller ternary system domain bpX0
MIGSVKHTIEYFRAPAKYFWQWADAGEVIEWQDGTTICYRDELVLLLRDFYCYRPPSLSALLLLLAACNKNFEQCGGKGILAGLLQTTESYNNHPPGDAEKEELQLHLNKALQFMDVVSSLPEELRNGRERLSLMQQVFSADDFSMTFAPLKDAADELDTGKVDQFVFRKIFPVTTTSFKDDVAYLSNALDKYPNADILAFRLRTGLAGLPAPADFSLVEEKTIDLFTALLQDPHTAGVARLAQHIVAAINIPMHVEGSSDMPLGGISDITNRGNFDRLLLSELAYEDELLMARLVNNEALFLRREEPPEHPKLQRTILLDTTIKMWGLPRVFAVSAALAVAQNRKHHELVEGYALGGENYSSMDLYSKEGVTEVLGKLDHALHCGTALETSIKEIVSTEGNEFFLLTDASTFESKSFYPFFSSVKERINYVITVSRDGALKFYSWINGKSKLISAAKLDLEELLFEMADEKSNKESSLPIFFNTFPAPLYFPVSRINKDNQNRFGFLSRKNGVIGVNEVQRVLLWGESYTGARELIDYIEKGKYFFGCDDENMLYIFVHAETKENKLYKISIINTSVHVLENIPSMAINEVQFYNEFFLICGQAEVISVDYISGKFISTYSYVERAVLVQNKEKINIDLVSIDKVPRHTWNNESILFKIDKMHVNSDGELVLGKHILKFSSSNHVSIVNDFLRKGSVFKQAKELTGISFPVRNPFVRFNKWVWKDGSEAVTDSRGLLHLRSSDAVLPEITIVMVLGRASACWASDGFVCGSDYFTGVKSSWLITVDQFNKKYIQPFINRLI